MSQERMEISRRRFVTLGAVSGAAFIVAPRLAAAQTPAKKEPLKAELVVEFVRAAHADLEKVKSLLAEQPALLNATWDWGGGDFEAAIGGAGHMGRKDIANYLIEKGARFDVFVAAMLGRLDHVKAILDAYPSVKASRGPHGIPLSAHAKAGGDDAKAVLEYLQSIGAA